MTTTSHTYRLVETTRANELFGATRTVTIERLTLEADGIRVDRHITGIIDGERIDRSSSKFYPGVSLDAAHAYRLRLGYSAVDADARRRVTDRKPLTPEQLAVREYATI